MRSKKLGLFWNNLPKATRNLEAPAALPGDVQSCWQSCWQSTLRWPHWGDLTPVRRPQWGDPAKISPKLRAGPKYVQNKSTLVFIANYPSLTWKPLLTFILMHSPAMPMSSHHGWSRKFPKLYVFLIIFFLNLGYKIWKLGSPYFNLNTLVGQQNRRKSNKIDAKYINFLRNPNDPNDQAQPQESPNRAILGHELGVAQLRFPHPKCTHVMKILFFIHPPFWQP